jgi:apolipoprotein N-acyltransferase
VRAVNHGISAVVDPYGRVVQRIGLLTEGMIVQQIARIEYRSFYVRFGPLVPVMWALLSVIAALTLHRRGDKATCP